MRHISITGSLGSGKSVVSARLKQLLNMEIESIGSIQRKTAQKYGMTTIEFNKYMETHHEIDAELDAFVEKEGRNKIPKIFDSRLAWHFVPNSLKVYLYTDEQIAAERIFKDRQRIGEGYLTWEDTLESIKARRNSEILRYKNQYGLDLEQLSNYDIVLDTGHTTIEENAKLLKKVYESPDGRMAHLWLSPKTLKPTEGCREYGLSYMSGIKREFTKLENYQKTPVDVIFYNNHFFIFDGHKRVLNSLTIGLHLLPCRLVNNSKEFRLFGSQTVESYIKDHCTHIVNADWEDTFDNILNAK